MQSKAKHVDEYLDALPEERKAIISEIRRTILQNLPEGFEEVMSYGMIGYVVPLSIYPAGYHCTPALPLPFMNLASQKNHIALYHMGINDADLMNWFTNEWKKYTSGKPDMGKACIRFKKPEEISLQLIGDLVARMTVRQWIDYYEKALADRRPKN